MKHLWAAAPAMSSVCAAQCQAGCRLHAAKRCMAARFPWGTKAVHRHLTLHKAAGATAVCVCAMFCADAKCAFHAGAGHYVCYAPLHGCCCQHAATAQDLALRRTYLCLGTATVATAGPPHLHVTNKPWVLHELGQRCTLLWGSHQGCPYEWSLSLIHIRTCPRKERCRSVLSHSQMKKKKKKKV